MKKKKEKKKQLVLQRRMPLRWIKLTELSI